MPHPRRTNRKDRGQLTMKKLSLLIIALFILIASVSAIELNFSASEPEKAGSVTQAQLEVVALRYEPYPAQPGDYITVWVSVRNIGKNAVYNANIEVVEEAPFSIDGENIKTLKSLEAGQEVLLKFEKIRISEDAVEGENTLKIKLPGPYGVTITKEIPISIRSVSPIIQTRITSIPEKIPQGEVATVNVEITNPDTAAIRDITVKFELPNELIPLGSTTERKINKLLAGKTSVVSFDIMAAPNAEAHAYKTPLVITFADETGAITTKNESVGLLVGSEDSYALNVDESSAFTANTKGTFVLSVANTGPNELKFVTVNIEPSNDYTIVSNSKVYLGNLDPDDFETSEFTVITHVQKQGSNCWIPFKCASPNTMNLNIALDYRNSYNQPITEKRTVSVPIYTSSEIKQYGLAPTSSFGLVTIIFLVILLIYLYLSYKHWRKEKHLGVGLQKGLRDILRGIIAFFNALRWRNLKRLPQKLRAFVREP